MLVLLTMIKNYKVIFKNRKELETARVAYLLVFAITMSVILSALQLSVLQMPNFVDALLCASTIFAALYIASFMIFGKKRVHLEESDGPFGTACNDK